MGTCVSITFQDKKGSVFEVKDCSSEDLFPLLDMYSEFLPKPASQGLPPMDPDACGNWVKGLLEEGENFLAWRDGRVIGHAALIHDPDKGDGEFLIFVDRSCRNRGVGKALTRMALDRAGELGLAAVWLSVETYNFRAINLYKRFEFIFCDTNECERTMICQL